MDKIYIVLFIALFGCLILLFNTSLPYEEETQTGTKLKVGDEHLGSTVTKCVDSKLCLEDNEGKESCIVDKENC